MSRGRAVRRSMLLLCAAAALIGCAPATSSPGEPVTRATDKLDAGSAVLLATWGPEQSRVMFNAGTEAALSYTLRIDGQGIRVNAPQYCRADQASVLCTVPTLPAGGNFILPMRGSNLSAVAVYKRASGSEHRLTVRQ